MSDPRDTDANPSATERSDIGFDIDEKAGQRSLLLTVGALAAFIAALALIPMAIGFGPFGLRVITSKEIPVHVLNLSGEDVTIALSFASEAQVVAGTMDSLETLAGPVSLESRSLDGEVMESITLDATGPVFYNVGGGRCFAVFDISAFYDGESEVEENMTVVARLGEETRIHVFEADTVVLPRRVAPDQAIGVVHWLEPVGCGLLDPEEEPYLIGTSLVRLQQRRENYEEARDAAREAAGY